MNLFEKNLNDKPFICDVGHAYTRRQLWELAWQLSLELPSSPVFINLYEDRLLFIVMLMAVGLKGGRTILPPDTAEHTLLELVLQHSGSLFIMSEFSLPKSLKSYQYTPDNIPSRLQSLTQTKSNLVSLLNILKSEIWLYTSGSTGRPKCIKKTWNQMAVLAHKAIERFKLDDSSTLLSTVPCQHMYGLETSVFWPLLSNAKLWRTRLFYPADIESTILKSTSPCILISTPVHLKTFVSFETQPLTFDMVISATAPMDNVLADSLRDQFNVKVCEVFGSTETASFASRCFKEEGVEPEFWEMYSNNVMTTLDSGQTVVYMQDLNETHVLNDHVAVLSSKQFKLVGRRTDLIKLAGKRQTLAYLNNRLQRCVEDGVFIWSSLGERLEAIVQSTLSTQEIRSCLKEFIDPVFLPRQIFFVTKLPRNELGKLTRKNIDELVKQLRSQKIAKAKK